MEELNTKRFAREAEREVLAEEVGGTTRAKTKAGDLIFLEGGGDGVGRGCFSVRLLRAGRSSRWVWSLLSVV